MLKHDLPGVTSQIQFHVTRSASLPAGMYHSLDHHENPAVAVRIRLATCSPPFLGVPRQWISRPCCTSPEMLLCTDDLVATRGDTTLYGSAQKEAATKEAAGCK